MSRHSDGLVSLTTLWSALDDLERRQKAEAPFTADFAAKREERLILEFRRIVREAETEYVTTTRAANLTGWDAATIRLYAKRAVNGDPLPKDWGLLVAKKEGKEYGIVLATVPIKSQSDSNAA